jgi:hypothetical protein
VDCPTYVLSGPVEGTSYILDKEKEFYKDTIDKYGLMSHGSKLSDKYDAALLYTEDITDAVQAAKMLLFTSGSTMQQMQKVMDTVDKITAEEKESLVINSFFLDADPYGEHYYLDFRACHCLSDCVSCRGGRDAAFGVYGIVDDPQKFYFLVCAALIGVREIDFTRAAESRRSMSEKKTSALEKFIQS